MDYWRFLIFIKIDILSYQKYIITKGVQPKKLLYKFRHKYGIFMILYL